MRPNSRYQFAIATICALALEAEAVEAAFDETYDRLCRYYGKQQGDSNCAASVASSLRIFYTSIELALVVGECGGAPKPLNG
ncbi:hypothetical protein CBS147343_3025 [Aspergillus niger]|nr:hypothetical protein CBS133816_746 [Aspergillus niger]KAI2848378.1 hypothetical protein CBS11350_2791 [Aspergillus niger]KAI2856164.1 hypothetical protein CBS12448_7020 [Aspergillus niger]KAI2896911.1 hypothetical protein CBS13152_3375 [Aspergillus niger]KAI2900154.1 hypothetical protein CBS11852_2948 [Aspergillus niger]